jgi:hypothetical protein
MIEKSMQPIIRQIKNIDDPYVRGLLCDSLMEMCDELISEKEEKCQQRQK